MIDICGAKKLANDYDVPLEDVLFIALNINGVNYECDYNRMRMAFSLANDDIFSYARIREERDYYFALPINNSSPFKIVNNILFLNETKIGLAINPTEDICDSNYPRRKGTSLNINPNSRTSCRGCKFCYTAYQVPYDRKKLKTESDLEIFFENWLIENGVCNLSHLIQVSIVTGCYDDAYDLIFFLSNLKKVLGRLCFKGKIFYLGSQITTKEQLLALEGIKPFGICYSIETLEKRHLLHDKKKILSIDEVCKSMSYAQELGYEVNFSYIVGMEPLDVIGSHFGYLKKHINKFPTINTLQIHKHHNANLRVQDAYSLRYYLDARKIIEFHFSTTNLRPLVWEDYRSLWFLKFGKEALLGIRTP